MTMEDISDRSTLHSIRREQERERRRMRDRERRQSMTLEQRERHLARRRRNYQLRRQRNKHLEYNYQPGPSETASSGEISERSEKPGEVGNQCRDLVPVGFDHVLQETDTDSSKYDGTESLAYDLAKLQKRLRLNHVKHFARSLKRPLSEFNGSNLQIVSDLLAKGNPSSLNCKSSQCVRLNRLKRLARAANSASKENAHHQHQSETNDTDLSNSKIESLDGTHEEKVNSNGNHQ